MLNLQHRLVTKCNLCGSNSANWQSGFENHAADIEKLFQLTIRVYQHPNEQRTFYAPDTEPSVDATLAVPLLNISGLDNYSPMRPASLHLATTDQTSNPTPNIGSGPGGYYLGKDFRQA